MFEWLRTKSGKTKAIEPAPEETAQQQVNGEEHPTFAEASSHFRRVSSSKSIEIPAELVASAGAKASISQSLPVYPGPCQTMGNEHTQDESTSMEATAHDH